MADTASPAKPNGNRRQLLTGLAVVQPFFLSLAIWGATTTVRIAG